MDIASYLSWARGIAWLWQKGRRGKIAAVVGMIAFTIVLLMAFGPPPHAGPKAQIKGAALCCSREGWPIVDKETVRLSGVGPIADDARDQFANWIKSHGSYLECDSSDHGSTYRCLTPQRLDVAQALLLNGATRAIDPACRDAACPNYRAAEEQAEKMRRGSRQ